MPYIKQTEKDFSKVTRIVRGYTEGSAGNRLAEALEVSNPTGVKLLNNPEQLTLAQVKKISNRLHVPKDELLEALRW